MDARVELNTDRILDANSTSTAHINELAGRFFSPRHRTTYNRNNQKNNNWIMTRKKKK